ncbi:hypothetical protein [Flagellimonas pacifica]|uniref:Uncharacterized protein n=1 Tax=Flagellimonas pacifica TaxID=1247520 RepID=A0A285MZF2_9FLAO|nr:hypothetical protein [Allomuricauda parva]SNZ01176.1 hypothetical protein SAMN06265377_3009 [Allomuricauda parva]
MKRKNLLALHIAATIIGTITISTFFILSLRAELVADKMQIKAVKTGILYALPILVIAMPSLAISGKKLAGKSKHPIILKKLKRMKLVMINGIILISLVIFLYYRAIYKSIDNIFLYAQIAELIFGLSNLTLIGINIKSGLQLSGKLKNKVKGP